MKEKIIYSIYDVTVNNLLRILGLTYFRQKVDAPLYNASKVTAKSYLKVILHAL